MLGVPIRDGGSDSQDLNRTIEHPGQPRRPHASPRRWRWSCRRSSNEIRSLPERAAPLLHVPAPGDGAVRAGPGGADRPPRRRVRVLRRRARPAAALAGRDRRRLRLQLRARRRRRRATWSPSRKPLGPGREGAWSRSTASASARRLHAARRDAARWSRKRWLRAQRRRARSRAYDRALDTGGPLEGAEIPGYTDAGPEEPVKVADRVLAGFGWQRDDVKLVQQMASNGAEPIGSLGYDGPLAALSPERQNLADYFKETVAVVTNPAIDREREIEHFSTRAVFGRRPSLDDAGERHRHGRDRVPGDPRRPPRPGAALRQDLPPDRPRAPAPTCSRTSGRSSAAAPRAIDISLLESETTQGAIERIKQEAVKKVARRRRAARPHRPHRLRRRAPLPRPAPGDLRRSTRR